MADHKAEGKAPAGDLARFEFPPFEVALKQEHDRHEKWYSDKEKRIEAEYVQKLAELDQEREDKLRKLAESKRLLEINKAAGRIHETDYDNVAAVYVFEPKEQKDLYETLRAARPGFYMLQCLGTYFTDVKSVRGMYMEAGVSLPKWFTEKYGPHKL
jgi:hypothetical protein